MIINSQSLFRTTTTHCLLRAEYGAALATMVSAVLMARATDGTELTRTSEPLTNDTPPKDQNA